MRRLALLGGTAALLLAGCATPKGDPQVAQVAPATLGLGTATPAIAADWWRAFGDPQLDRLIAAGLAGNPSLQAALARVRIADAELGTARADLQPHVSAYVSPQEYRMSHRFIGEGGWTTVGIVESSLSWNIDLFGRQHAAVERAGKSADAAALDAASARLTLAASIAQTYVGLAQAEKQIAVANDFVATRRRALGYVQTRIRDQLSSQFDLRTAQTLVAEAEQSQVRALRERDLLIHALAALIGRGADVYPQISAPVLALDSAPPAVPAVLAADLIGRRPDLLAAQARIDASVANRHAARLAYLPNVSVTALAGLFAFGASNLFTASAAQYGGGPAISLPIFEGGKLKAQYQGATAELDGAIADYNDAVIGAVRESADAVTNVRAADADLATQARIVAGLRDTVRLNEVRTRTGLGSQLDAIESGFRLLEAEQALVGLQADAFTRRIALIAALGGGYAPAAPVKTAATAASDPHS